jgi:hypothetical protein
MTWHYLAVLINQDHLSGEIDLHGLLRFINGKGLVSDTAVNFGSCTQTINTFDYQISCYVIASGADSLIGTAQNDVINALAGVCQ